MIVPSNLSTYLGIASQSQDNCHQLKPIKAQPSILTKENMQACYKSNNYDVNAQEYNKISSFEITTTDKTSVKQKIYSLQKETDSAIENITNNTNNLEINLCSDKDKYFCTTKNCTASGTKDDLLIKQCPYPLTQLISNNSCTATFLQDNQQQIICWLNEEFENKLGLSEFTAIYRSKAYKRCRKQRMTIYDRSPLIYIEKKETDTSLPYPIFYYSSVDFNDKKDIATCFSNLLFDIRSDLLAYFLEKNYPNAFNRSTDAYIYNFTNNDNSFEIHYIIEDGKKNVSISSIFNYETKEFDFDKLKNKIGEIDYNKLFSLDSTFQRSVWYNDSPIYKDKYGNDYPFVALPRVEEKNNQIDNKSNKTACIDSEIPSGVLELSEFIF